MTGSGTLTLKGTNTYGGGTAILTGSVAVDGDAALGATAGNVTVGDVVAGTSGALLYTQGSTVTTSRNYNFVTNAAGVPSGGGGSIDFNNQNATLNGVIGGNGPFTVKNAGTVTLANAANLLTGSIAVQQGTLAASSLGSPIAGATLTLGTTTNAATFTETLASGNVSESRNVLLPSTVTPSAGAGTISVTNAATNLTLTGTVSGGGLNKTGAVH